MTILVSPPPPRRNITSPSYWQDEVASHGEPEYIPGMPELLSQMLGTTPRVTWRWHQRQHQRLCRNLVWNDWRPVHHDNKDVLEEETTHREGKDMDFYLKMNSFLGSKQLLYGWHHHGAINHLYIPSSTTWTHVVSSWSWQPRMIHCRTSSDALLLITINIYPSYQTMPDVVTCIFQMKKILADHSQD